MQLVKMLLRSMVWLVCRPSDLKAFARLDDCAVCERIIERVDALVVVFVTLPDLRVVEWVVIVIFVRS